MELFEKKLNSRQIFDGVVVKLFVDEVELPNGEKSVREIVRHPGAVCVIPVTDEGDVIMVRQFRYAFGKVLLEIPAGKLEPGEDPLAAAQRELEEETGIVADSVTHIGSDIFHFVTPLTHVHLGAGLEDFPEALLCSISQQVQLTISENNPYFIIDENVVYNKSDMSVVFENLYPYPYW